MDTILSKETSPVESAATKGGQHEVGVTEVFVDPDIEKRAIKKFDRLVLPQMALIMLIAYLDRANIGNAVVFGLKTDLNFHGHQFNYIVMIFYVTYIVFDIPWVMCVKRFGGHKVLAVAMGGWSLVTLGTGFIQNYGQAITVRLLLGLFEAGLLCCLTFIITMVYSREQQARRVGVLYYAVTCSGAFGGLIAYGIQTMGSQLGIAAWRWLFIIEGAVSFVVCSLGWLSLPKSAGEAWFLTEEEREVMRARRARDASYSGGDDFSWKYVSMAFSDIHVYVAAICLFCASIPATGFATFLPTILLGLGYTSLQANYLSIPVYALATIVIITVCTLSDKYKHRSYFLMCIPAVVIIGYIIILATPNGAAGYFAMFMVGAGIYPFNCLLLTWASNNFAPDYKRSVALPLFASISSTSGLVSSEIYPASDSPRYIKGNAVSLGMEVLALVGIMAIYFILKSRSDKKAEMLAQGATENGKSGDKGLHFQYTM
ncbi:uncharacterized protein Z520_09158 [Fonsecaea multimorphosa CBS 102226]|uniref:Major facilitator superfamily (MFS) profile domain-containing protein n=1 Tax=Fonsecaea multimorphosa CBS 102226 TaxID=1442371 RepID=A0A0D2IDM5_9EURO|nr:uncharacterized protein Z520_09158 [Fonsecaea multimorphosa CBS 102226]KIX95241.1 hypothetical protein Z520_09158 [Fonsecaea multimorphosa CBS 102226]OAL17266.1 hypothetical protein AYO22_11831 [Fonsecaea multimorphosa]